MLKPLRTVRLENRASYTKFRIDPTLFLSFLFSSLGTHPHHVYSYASDKTVDKNRGRIEIRQAWTIADPQVIAGLRNTEHFAKLNTVMKVRLERYIGAERSVEQRYSRLYPAPQSIVPRPEVQWPRIRAW